MTTTQLTVTQHAVLAHAIHHSDGKLDWFPDNIKGGARKKVLDGLFNRALITTNGTNWFVAAEGYDALGCARPAPAPLAADPEIEAAVTAAEATWAQERTDTKPRTRENSKQATGYCGLSVTVPTNGSVQVAVTVNGTGLSVAIWPVTVPLASNSR